MHPGIHAAEVPDKPAYIMANSGQVVSYRELNEASNRGAQLFRSLGLGLGDNIAIFMENNAAFLQICWAAHRAGLYYTCISSYLMAEEVAYIVGNCGARVFITSEAKAEVAAELEVRREDPVNSATRRVIIRRHWNVFSFLFKVRSRIFCSRAL